MKKCIEYEMENCRLKGRPRGLGERLCNVKHINWTGWCYGS